MVSAERFKERMKFQIYIWGIMDNYGTLQRSCALNGSYIYIGVYDIRGKVDCYNIVPRVCVTRSGRRRMARD